MLLVYVLLTLLSPACSLLTHKVTAVTIDHFRVPKTVSFKAMLSAKPFLWKWVYLHEVLHENKNGFALSFALKKRLGATRKMVSISSHRPKPPFYLRSLHNVVFLIASTVHLGEILLRKCSSNCKSLQFLRKKQFRKAWLGIEPRV